MKRIKNLSRRGLALLMTLTMCLSLLPATAMAEDVKHDPSTHITENGWTCVKGELTCTKESHGHGADCYGAAPLTCDISEAHEHTDECYNADRELICGYLTAHAHTDECYKTEEVLVCQAEEHKHTEDCYDAEGSLTCKLHEHTDACYETRRGEQLICDLEEIKAHEHGTACYGEAPLTCQLQEHEHTDGCYAWTCTYTKPVQEIPAEVRAFVKAVEALPEAEEITVENAVDVGEQIQALEDVSYVAEDYMDDEEVYTACLKYMDVSYAVTQALELVGETYYDVNGDDWWYHGNGNGSFGVENLNEAIQNSNGEFIIYIKADSAVTFDRSVVIPDNKTVKVYNYGTNRTIQRNGDYPLFVVKGGGTLLIGGDSLTLDGDSNNTTNNSLLVVESGGVLTLDNQLKVQNAKTSQRGGGVYVHGGGTLTINNGVQFKDCSASQGANVYVESGATFNNRANIDKVHKENGGGSSSGFETDGDKGRVYLTVNTGAYAGLPSEPSVVRDRFIWNANENENDQCWGKAYAITRNPAEILNESILKSEYFIKDTASATWGVSDSTGEKTIGFLTEAAKTRLNTFLDKLATSNWADLDVLDQYGQKGKLTSSNVAQYELIPYVIKYQTEERAYDPVIGQWDQDANRIGWHIDCAVVPKVRLQLNYALNLPDGVSTENPFALPTGKIGTGNSMTERVGSLCYNNSPVNVNDTVSASYDGKSGLYLKFTGWNTEADGTGTSYSPADSITVDKTNSPVILYAQWVVTSPKYKVQWLDKDGTSLKTEETRYPTPAEFKEGTVAVKETDKADITKADGTYVFDKDNQNNCLSAELKQSGTELKLYFKLRELPKKQITDFEKALVESTGDVTDTLVNNVTISLDSYTTPETVGEGANAKSVIRLPADANKPLLYKLTVTGNPGAAFEITEEQNVTLVGATDSSVKLENQKLTGTIPTADGDTAGTTKSVTIYVSMDAPTLTGDAITMDAVNKATLTAGDKTEISPDGETSRDKIEKEVKTPASKVALSVTKTTTATTVKPDETITWTITVKNEGKVPAENVKLDDVFTVVKADTTEITIANAATISAKDPVNTNTENFTVPAATETAPGTVTFTATYKVPESAKVTVGEGKDSVDLSGLTLKNVAKVTYGTEEIPSKPSEVKVEQKKITSFTKELVTDLSDAPTGVTLQNVTIADGKIKVAKDAKSIQLLYKLTVTGDPGASYSIEDDGAVAVAGYSLTGTLANTDTATEGDKVTKTIYVTMTFTKDNDDKFTVEGQAGALTNKATIEANPEKPTPVLPEKTDPEVKSYLLTVEYKVDGNGTKPTDFPPDYTRVVQTGSYSVDVPTVTGYGLKEVTVDGTKRDNVSVGTPVTGTISDANVKVVVTYSADDYTLEFALRDNNETTNKDKFSNKTGIAWSSTDNQIPAETPARPGYKFTGWYKTVENEEVVTDSKVTGTPSYAELADRDSTKKKITLYAGWEAVAPVIGVVKDAKVGDQEPTIVQPGDKITYIVTITPQKTDGVQTLVESFTIVDPMMVGATDLKVTAKAADDQEIGVTKQSDDSYKLNTPTAGEITVTYTYTVKTGDGKAQTGEGADASKLYIHNEAKVTATFKGEKGTETSGKKDVEYAEPAFKVEKTVTWMGSDSTPAAPVNAGTVLNYTITVTNTGKVPLKKIELNDALSLQNKDNTSAGKVNGSTGEGFADKFTVENLDAGKAKEFTYTYIVDPLDEGKTLVNTVTTDTKGLDSKKSELETKTEVDVSKVSVSGTKVWEDSDDANEVRPGSITVNLFANGTKVGEPATANAGSGWEWSFTDLNKYNDKGQEITYTVTEAPVEGYTSVVDGKTNTITNTIIGGLGYTVKYLEKGTNKVLKDETTSEKKLTYGTVIAAGDESKLATISGYKYDSASPESLVVKDSDASKNVLTLYFTKVNGLSYTVNYLEQGTNAVLATAKTVDGKTFGDEVSESAIDITGYNKADPASATITIADGDNTINFYYTKRTDLSYTVRYLRQSDNAELRAARTVENQTFGSTVTETAPSISGYTLVGNTSRSITIQVTGNVITFYYTANGGNGGGTIDFPDPTPTPTPRPTPIPDDPTPVDPGTSIDDETTPLAGAVGLNNVDHFAYIVGYDDNTVRPTNNITRAEVATIFFRLMEDDYRAANWATENSFSDVSVGQWYNNAISTCARAGALGGYEDGSFRPENPITRAEFAVIASRFLGEEYTDEGVGDFSDTQGHWAAKEIRRAVKAGWITGEGNKFRPEDPITRAEVMTIVNRMLDRLPDAEHFLPDMIHWIDNPEGTWYYEAVQEATNEHAYERDELNAETWTQLLPARKWAELEKSWADAYAAG